MRSQPLRRRLTPLNLLLPIALAASPLLAAGEPPVLLVVPPASDVAAVEAARSSVPPSRALLTVGATERVALREGVELVLDRSFSEAPPSDLVVVLPGEAAGEEEFLIAHRKTARVILFLGDSPLVKRLKGNGSRGALLLVGGPQNVRALAAEPAAPAAAASPEKTRADAIPTARPTAPPQAAATPAEGAVQRYFSARKPTPAPTPPPH
jgi:hypothetical protein